MPATQKQLIQERLSMHYMFRGRCPEEGRDWALTQGGGGSNVLYVAHKNGRGQVVLHVEDVSAGNATDHIIHTAKQLDGFKSAPYGIRKQLGALLN